MEDTDDVDLCLQILAVVTTVYRPLTLDELGTFVKFPQDIQCGTRYAEYYTGLCGSFLALREYTVYFIHQSARDFLCTPSLNAKFPQVFTHGMAGVHRSLFSKALGLLSQTLHRNMYQVLNPGILVEDIIAPTPDPLAHARYSCRHWADHLCEFLSYTTPTQTWELLHDLESFFKDKYLNMLEALSLMKDISGGVLAIGKLHNFLPRFPNGIIVDELK